MGHGTAAPDCSCWWPCSLAAAKLPASSARPRSARRTSPKARPPRTTSSLRQPPKSRRPPRRRPNLRRNRPRLSRHLSPQLNRHPRRQLRRHRRPPLPKTTGSIVDDVDFEFADTISADAISLDADLDAGTGLQEGSELDVAQDFGFSPSEQAASDFDFEITETAAADPEPVLTEINPAAQISEPTAAASEDDDEYDMSMIVDATRQTIDEDLTEKDLNAIPVEDKVDDYSVADDTLHTKVDLQTLEQDYQDEYTATLAANQEIEEAAAELALQLNDSEDDAGVTARVETAPDLEPTAHMPVDAGMEPTREMPADPGLEPTAQMPADPALEPTAMMPADPGMEPTPEMPIDAGLDPTAEMSVSTSDSGVNAELTDSIPIDIDALNDALAAEDITARVAAAGAEATVEMPARPDEKKSDQ